MAHVCAQLGRDRIEFVSSSEKRPRENVPVWGGDDMDSGISEDSSSLEKWCQDK